MSITKMQVDLFEQYCIKNFNLGSIKNNYKYQSLSACILDCVYSLRARYESCTVPVVERYAAKYMGGDRFAPNITLNMLIDNINNEGGCVDFAVNLLKNKQKIGGVLKSEICYNLAQSLISLNIKSLSDFQSYSSTKELEDTILSIKGVGYAALNYLFMLAGDQNRCKPDVHIHKCVKEALGCDLKDSECQDLFSQVIPSLNKYYPYLTIRQLDHIIWNIFKTHK